MTNTRNSSVPSQVTSDSCNLSAIDGILCKILGSRTTSFFFMHFFFPHKRPDVGNVEDQGI